MNLLRALMLIISLLTLGANTSQLRAQDTIDASKLLGSWKAIASEQQFLEQATANLGIYETLTMTIKVDGKDVPVEGRYEVSGHDIKVTTTNSDGTARTGTYKIDSLSDSELVVRDDEGKVTRYQKTKNPFAPPTQEEWAAIVKGGGYYEGWKESDGTLYSDIVYDEQSKLQYDLFIPASASRNTNHGVIVMLHGGGWNSGSRKSLSWAARRYAKAGYITSLVSYSFITPGSSATMERLLDDIQHATASIKSKTAELGYSVNKLGLFGVSAGGHLAMLYGYSRADQSPIPVALVFEHCGTTDFHPDSFRSTNTSARLVSSLTGKPVTAEMVESGEAEALIDSISPASFVNSKTVPTLFGYGGKDDIVLPIHAEKLDAVLKANGVKHEYIAYPNSGHFLDSDPASRDRFKQVSLEYLREAFGY